MAPTSSDPRIRAGQQAADRGDLAEAEQLFSDALDASRSRADLDELAALCSLITLYGRTGRLFEALVLARHLASRAEVEGDVVGVLFAQAAICNVLGDLRRYEALERELTTLDHLLAAGGARVHDGARREFLSLAIGSATRAGDALKARSLWLTYSRLAAGDDPRDPVDTWVLAMHDAALSTMEGQPGRALEILEALGARGGDLGTRRIEALRPRVRALLALGRADEALEAAEEGLAMLRRIRDEPELSANRILRAGWIARLYEEHGRPDRAREIHMLVAEAIMLRIVQLEAAMRRLPELGLPMDESELTGFRQDYLRDQRDVLTHVAELVREQPALRQHFAREHADGTIVVCAWCERVRPEGTTWLPIGQFVPRHAGLKLTHSICPPCAERVTA
ncbi:MAG: hypothetical protein R3F05_05820 [Planctomycetota bacterium]